MAKEGRILDSGVMEGRGSLIGFLTRFGFSFGEGSGVFSFKFFWLGFKIRARPVFGLGWAITSSLKINFIPKFSNERFSNFKVL